MRRFRNLGLIEIKLDRFLVINEKKLTDYLARMIAIAAGTIAGLAMILFKTVQY